MESDPSRMDQFGFRYQPAEYFWQPEWMTWIVVGIIVVSAVAIMFLPWLKGFRTWLFGAVSTAWLTGLPLLYDWTGYLKDLDWTSYVPTKYVPYIPVALTLAFMFFKWISTPKMPGIPQAPKMLRSP